MLQITIEGTSKRSLLMLNSRLRYLPEKPASKTVLCSDIWRVRETNWSIRSGQLFRLLKPLQMNGRMGHCDV